MNIILDDKAALELNALLLDYSSDEQSKVNAGIVIYRNLNKEDKKSFFNILFAQKHYSYKNYLIHLLLKSGFLEDFWVDLESLDKDDFKKLLNTQSIKFILNNAASGNREKFPYVYRFCTKYLTKKSIRKFITNELFNAFFSHGENTDFSQVLVIEKFLPELERLKINMQDEFLYLCKHWERNQQDEIMNFLLSKKKTTEFKRIFKIPKSIDLRKIWLTCLNDEGVESVSRYEDLLLKASYSYNKDLDIDPKKIVEIAVKQESLRLLCNFADNEVIFYKILKNFPDNIFYKLSTSKYMSYSLSEVLQKCCTRYHSFIFKKYLKGEKLCK